MLYNFRPANPSVGVSIDNIPTEALMTFTNTRSEEQFYVISAQCEIAGAEALRLMRQSLDELFLADNTALKRLTTYLARLARQIDLIGDITLSMLQHVDPEEFYHLIRPWFRGGDGDGPQSLGWDYQGTKTAQSAAESVQTGTRESMFSGPSAGQSSLIHAIDVFLTVDHSPTEEERETEAAQEKKGEDQPTIATGTTQPIMLNETPVQQPAQPNDTTSSTPPKAKTNEATFVQRMLQYMPAQHRSFLQHLSTHPTPLRQLVVAHAHTHPRLAKAYDGALEALKRFREKHMRIVSFFIIQQARRAPSERIAALIAADSSSGGAGVPPPTVPVPTSELRGTGGSPLFKFLKRCRDNTTKAMIGSPAGPGYELEQ